MKRIITNLKAFRDEDQGSLAIETVILIPLLFWAYLSMFAIFDSFRQHSINQKAAYTLGDIISRETTPLDNSYLNGTQEIFAYLTNNVSSDVSIRVTSVKYDANNNVYKRDWSKARGWKSPLSNNEVKELKHLLPVMPHNERVMVVETFAKYDAPFETGLRDREIDNFVFTRPRYAPRVLWSND
ncbi:TadE/TadG family type IV pilus assembly protein [Tateyamaria omphalii]|uniref:Pilus assembly protein TadE n=1 Tax=Tateyamaria omphalii TaxID=299262 RepID=A0A1P8MWQ7_9RHOB|nr:hypothetical protein [Tateyamaria omphalii]APX12359.1 hypothetical protein BWR18_12225 [Tateyamaria omphalii]